MDDGGILTADLGAEARRAFLAQLLRKEEYRRNLFPLSSAQRRMWTLWRLDPDSPAYNVPGAVRFGGLVDIPLLRRCLAKIVMRHDTLRTTFMVVNGRPMQVVAPVLELSIPVIDLQHLLSDEQEAEVLRLVTEDAKRPFDLTKGPLIRFSFVLLSQVGLVMIVNLHHIVADGWSLGILTREVEILYEAFRVGDFSSLPELPIQYVDYAVWEQKQLQGKALERQQAYWKQQLADAPVLLELPTDRPRPSVQTLNGATYTFTLRPTLVEALQKLSRQESATLFMTLLAAFSVLLYRYTAQEDLLVGTAVANRNRVEIEGLIGFFVNTLVLRLHLTGNPRFRDLLKQVRRTTLEAYEHQALPFEQLLEILELDRDVSYSPLFQVMLTIHDAVLSADDPFSSLIRIENSTAMFDLALSLTDNGQDITVDCLYNTDLFDARTIGRMSGHFQTLLAGVIASPEAHLAELSLLTETERQQISVGWSDARADYPQNRCIHELFEAQAVRSPDAVALVFENERLTYQALNRRADQLAHYLRGLGVGPEVLVGLCVERSPEMVLGILGVLKAGGAYVPLDPAYPKERLTFILEDTQTPVLLTQQQLVERLPVDKARIICLDTGWGTIATAAEEDPVSDVTPDNLAYVIYTSGSTGRPKGVAIAHAMLCPLLHWGYENLGFTTADRSIQYLAYCFDWSVWEMFMALTSGVSLYLIASDMVFDPQGTIDLMVDNGITILHATPTQFQYLTALGQRLETLKYACIGAEKLPCDLAERCHGLLEPDCRLFNMYGPTEAAIITTILEIDRSAIKQYKDLTSVPIGLPVANARCYVLDKHSNLQPVGVSGELYISGSGLARGYLGRPELTAERFVPDPFMPQERTYRTGDLARWLADGSIEFLGRIDHQVKVRGFRIELGEIEAVLDQHPAVGQSVVLTWEDQPGERYLVAYVVPSHEKALTSDELYDFLQGKLPEYMVPSAFVTLETLPLTPTGKVNRQALPAPDKKRPNLEQTFLAPRTPVEQQLAAIWAEVLGIEQVGVHDNFFHLGGDSILAIQATARANEAGWQFTLKQLFQHQTVSELARAAGESPAVQAEQRPVTGQVPLTPIQRWLFEQNQPEINHFNQAVLLTTTRPLDVAILSQAIRALGDHHDVLRSRFVWQTSGWQQICLPPDDVAPLPLIEVDLSTLPESEQLEALEATAASLHASLDLSAGRLFCAAYFHLNPCQPDSLLMIIHHLVVDGVSWRILIEDLGAGYQQLSGGLQVVALPPKTTSFKQWSTRLAEYAQSPALQQEQGYWLAEERARVSRLPVDYVVETATNDEASARTSAVSLSTNETRALLQDVPRAYNTQINDALLAALAQALTWWTGARDLLVDLEGHGREQLFEDADVSRTVGWFTTIFPVYLYLGAATDAGSALKTVKEQLRRIPNHGIGYGLLHYLSNDQIVSARLAALPQAEISFNYLGRLDQTWPEDWLFDSSVESIGPLQSPRNGRFHLLSINSYIVNDQLVVNWAYSTAVHHQETIERLARRFIEALQAIIAHCQSPDAGGYTPSDFALANLDEQKLGKLARILEHVE